MTVTVWSVAYLVPLLAYVYYALLRRRTLIDPLLLGGAYLWAMFLFEGPRPHTVSTSYLLLLHCLCSAAYWIGGGLGHRWARSFRRSRYSRRELLAARNSTWLGAMVVALVLLTFIFIITYEGSLSVLLEMRKRPDQQLGSVTSHIGLLERLAQYLRGYMAPLATIAVLLWCRQRRLGFMPLAMLALTLTGWGVLGLGGGSRGAVLFLVIQCVFAVHYARGASGSTRMAARTIVALLIPIGAFVVLTQTLYRYTGLPSGYTLAQLEQRAGEAGELMLEHISFNDEVDFVLSTYPDFYDFTRGHSIITPLVVFVPRSLWAEKPVPWGRILAWHYGFRHETTVSMAATVPGEGYANFGVTGWALFPLVFGLTIGWTFYYLKNSRDEFDIVIGLWGLFWAISLRGDLHYALAAIIFPYLITAVCFRCLAFRRLQPAESEIPALDSDEVACAHS